MVIGIRSVGFMVALLLSFGVSRGGAAAPLNLGQVVPIDEQRFGSVADIFTRFHASQSWDLGGVARLTEGERPGVHTAAYLSARVLAAVGRQDEFAFLPPLDLANSELWVRTMNFGDPVFTALVLELKRLGLGRIKILATGSEGFDVRDGRDEQHRESELTPSSSGMGEAAKILLAAGFKLNPAREKPFEILTTSVHPRATIEDIMHEKALTLILRAQKAPGVFTRVFDFGRGLRERMRMSDNPWAPLYDAEKGEFLFSVHLTDNLTRRVPRPGGRELHRVNAPPGSETKVLAITDASASDFVFNHYVEVALPELIRADHAHQVALAEAFRRTGKIHDIEDPNPERTTFQFADGSFLQLMYTNGRVNPFVRERELFDRALDPNDSFRVRRVYRSHFIDVNGANLESLRRLLDHDRDIECEFIYSDDAVSPRRGVPAALMGLPVRSEQGLHRGFSQATRSDRLQVFVNRRVNVRSREHPGKVLNHTKLDIYEVIEDGAEWTYILWGSWNRSNHIENAEWQWWIRVPTDSRLARVFRESMLSQRRLRPELFDTLESTVELVAIADYIGVNADALTRDDFDRIQEALARNDFSGIREYLEHLYATRAKKKASRVVDVAREVSITVDAKEFRKRMDVLETAFQAWRLAIYSLRGQSLPESENQGLLAQLGQALVTHIHRMGSHIVDNIPIPFLDRGVFSPVQLITLLNALSTERTRAVQMARREAGITNTTGYARSRFYYAMDGGPIAVPEADKITSAAKLYNAVRLSLGLDEEDEGMFRANLEAELNPKPRRQRARRNRSSASCAEDVVANPKN